MNYPGLSKTNCAADCHADQCAISGRSICVHPCKSGVMNSLIADPAIRAAYGRACADLGVRNILEVQQRPVP
ncbi:hypothetical protein CSIRO_2775 [Bradyrhizobiaceae bacterium SG-6C]|nr:hypothetical protein CSIRO_2775 [Bradyrhizobiaceae bacterium SG-6C]